MPHAVTDHDAQSEADDLLIQKALDFDPSNDLDFNRELEPGEKAENAVDFEDISDNDLAEDEDEVNEHYPPAQTVDNRGPSFDDLPDLTQDDDHLDITGGNGDDGDEFDELFGDTPSSPVGGEDGQGARTSDQMNMSFEFENNDPFSGRLQGVQGIDEAADNKVQSLINQPIFRPVDFRVENAAPSKEYRLQQQLFAMSRGEYANPEHLPAPPESQEELLASLWPKFEKGAIPRFGDLLPPKKARFVGKTPFRVPKPVHPTKVNLELAQDQEKAFRFSSLAKKSQNDLDQPYLVHINDTGSNHSHTDSEVEIDSDFEGEPVGGVSWQDLQILCEDWDIHCAELSPSPDLKTRQWSTTADQDDFFADIYDELDRPSAKRQKLSSNEAQILARPQFSLPSLHDPELATSKIAKAVTLDLNNPHLLLQTARSTDNRDSNQFKRIDFARGGHAAFSKGLSRRYNISNDEAYDLLKENHQSKVRSTLGNVAISHSTPAVQLQWPYYKTKLGKQESRSFHRPIAHFREMEPIIFNQLKTVKRKHLKGKDTQAIFQTTKDMSLGDNSSVLLLEYSEEHPAIMSNFGMGSRLINYYRRKNMEDTTRPKLDIGETAVLLPQDKSPFSIFGHIDPGQITPALHNNMYRAPIFKQEAQSTDFLMIRNSTGESGATWFLRNIENLHVVGQEFPSVDVPGPHSRKVTTASKNRLKMISYRMIRKNKLHRIAVSDITKHFMDTTDMQNRQKMKEFMVFSKEHKEWEMRPGETIPEEDVVRTMVKPEDVCLLEAMQVGQQHLQDAGFSRENDESEDEEGKEGQSIEQQLAPWYTTRNFLNATSGKAMLQLHGEGDPTTRGEAFSFLKTSMKGGFKAIGESVEDKLDAKKLKENGGHSYNVAKQQKSYEESIRRIWEGQRQSLTSTIEHSDNEMDQDDLDEADGPIGYAMTPRSENPAQAAFRRHDNETASQYSRFSNMSQSGKPLRIIRRVKDQFGNEETVEEIVEDPRVIRAYLKRRHQREDENTNLMDRKMTGDVERDRRSQKVLQKELARLERNKDRRIARDKQKGIYTDSIDASPGSPSSPGTVPAPKGPGTQRKCANCGQVGHIKTNKKLCPMLNGTMKQEDGFGDTAFATGTVPP